MLSLPNEILDLILAHLRCSHIASAALVSRQWQSLFFSHLYSTVYLSLATHLKHFSERVASDDGSGPDSICANLKGLVLDHKHVRDRRAITEQDLVHLKPVIDRLTQLKHLSWELLFVPEDPEIMSLFQTRCPSLESVRLWIEPGHSEYASSFQFTKLTRLSIASENPSFLFTEEGRYSLTSLLTSCPNLVSFTLGQDVMGTYYCPSLFIETLDDQSTFPHLRTLFFQGNLDPNWLRFFDNPDTDPHPLRSFLPATPK